MNEKLNQKAKELNYGKIIVEYTVSRGKIVKAVIKESEETVLFDTRE